MEQEKAEALAKLIGGEAWNSGGDVYLVTVKRADGNVVAISDELIAVYPDAESVGDESALISEIFLV